ncbi:MAG: tetratricopeptide repeat protein, partial [Candidatus Tectomicrobia bacterium]|nr:tetratricopeptide repeat protein [Candidatus Tectomicrobia bacterium]
SLMCSSWAFASAPRLAIPPFKGSTRYPALLSGLQQMLIDDLRANNKSRVMTRLDLQTALKRLGKPSGTPLYVRDIPKFRGAFHNIQWILINSFEEHNGFCSWTLQLVYRETASAGQSWTFEGPLSNLFHMKQQAVSALQKALELRGTARPAPQNAEAKLSALMAYAQGLEAFDDYQYTQAAAHFRASLVRDKTFHYTNRQLNLVRSAAKRDLTSPRQLGLFWLADAQPNKARGYLKDALRLNPQDAEVMLALNRIEAGQDQVQAAQQLVSKAQKVEGSQRPQPWIERAKLAQAKGNVRDAIKMFEKAKTLAPENADTHYQLGELYSQAHQPNQAAQAYRTAGALYGKALQVDEATQAMSKAIDLTPDAPDLRLAQGDLFMQLGQPEKARAAYQKAQELAPKDVQPLQKLATLQQQLGQPAASFTILRNALAIQPNHVGSNLQMAQLHMKRHEYKKAETSLKRARKAEPGNAAIAKALAKVYAASGQLDAASETYQALAQDQSKDAGFYTTYGDVLRKQGRFAEAQLQYEKAIKLNPDKASVYKSLGLVHQEQGQVAKAKFALAQANRLNPKLTLPTIEAPNLQEGLLRLSASFPLIQNHDRATELALIDMRTAIQSGNGFGSLLRSVSDFGTLYRVDTSQVLHEFKQTLQQNYVVAPEDRVNAILASDTYRSMRPQDLDDGIYLAALCESLKADALMFYSMTSKGRTGNHYQFKIATLLFEKVTEAKWGNEGVIGYVQDQGEALNWPLVVALAVTGLLIVVGIVTYLVQGTGALRVIIQQDEEKKKAIFSIIISKKANKDLTAIQNKLLKKADKRSTNYKYERKVKFAKKYERYLALNDTLFERLHVGQYYVYLYGIIPNGRSGQISNYQMTQKVTIQQNRKQEILFDFRTTTRQVDIQVFSGEDAIVGAEVSIKGQGESRYIKEPTGTSFHLPVGTHTVLIHHEEKLFTKEIKIPNLDKDYHFGVDLPPAPEPNDAQSTPASLERQETISLPQMLP